MLCQECNKNQATVHLTKVVQGRKAEMHLCDVCAKDKQSKSFQDSFSIHNFLAGLLDINTEMGYTEGNKGYGLVCSKCNTSYQNFKEAGKLGCNHCYVEFKDKLNHLVRRIHGNAAHTGKIPKRSGGIIQLKREVKHLKLALDEAVKKQEFEKAVGLRDEIKALEARIKDM
ncbi:UvrB/UvrC motif-containing protein [Serpentinicella sp. ANB-PHB4]|uniref:UvrB/UvrC motif-containing protein n=1 Tax=Serpentinicella sp. ANB-PHB4 TaxID=3074076 RepID=UPI002862AF8C|nr:UvrB/UvrC motif-containing protein [Serpentinicella sp. ANB-PHB4]MDR5659909.1 UvrB/UvrC motif-containing protein [Serpentinicella sp. ANB-PHB4]